MTHYAIKVASTHAEIDDNFANSIQIRKYGKIKGQGDETL